MLNDTPLVHVDLSPEYKQNLRSLSKRYRNIRSDTQELLEQIQSGNFIGDRIAGLGEGYMVIKARVKNSNIQKGKSAGYRVIYQVESPTRDSFIIFHESEYQWPNHRYGLHNNVPACDKH